MFFSMFRTVFCLLLCLLPPGVVAAQAAATTRQTLVLGRVSDDPKTHIEAMQPILDYVVPKMRSVGIREGRILMAREAIQMQSYLRRQQVDWVTDTGIMAIDYQRRAGANVLLMTERGGGNMYRTVFFSLRGSGIDTLSDMKGRSIAFQSPYSTSSYIIPAAELLRAGLSLDMLLSPLDHADPERVGYLFARREENIATWVETRLVDVGAFSNLDWEKLLARSPERRNTLRIFHETGAYPRALEITAAGLDPAVRERLRQVLLEAGNDPAAREPLKRFFGTQRFMPLDSDMQERLIQLNQRLDLVREHLE